MKFSICWLLTVGVSLGAASLVEARGFGRAGGGAVAGPRGGAVGGYRAGGYVGPAGGAYAGGAARATAVGPYGGVSTGGARGGSYTTPGGTTIQAGQAGGVRVGPAGGVRAGGAEGVRVTTPGGRTYTNVDRGGVAAGPRGVVAGGSQRTVASGPGGVAVGGSRGGVAVGPYGGVAGGRAVAVGHSTRYVGSYALATQASVVRGTRYGCFNRSWYVGHPAAWRPYRWAAASFWAVPAWGVLGPYCGLVADAPPYNYDYGTTVVYNDNRVYSDGTLIGTAEQYAQQAIDLTSTGRNAQVPQDAEFQPLGVFGMIQGDEQNAQHIFQLGVNQQGIVRGNYYNALTDQTTPVYGSVNQKSQRVAWSVGDKKDIVFEAGLYNMTQQQCTALVHYGTERTIQMILVRLEEQQDQQPPQ